MSERKGDKKPEKGGGTSEGAAEQAEGALPAVDAAGIPPLKLSALETFKKCVDIVKALRSEAYLAIMFRRAGAKVITTRDAPLQQKLEAAGVDPVQFAGILHYEIVRICGGAAMGKALDPPTRLFGRLDEDGRSEWAQKTAYVQAALMDEALCASFHVNTTSLLPLFEDLSYQVITEHPEGAGGPVQTALLALRTSPVGAENGEQEERPVVFECGQEELRILVRCLSLALEDITPVKEAK